jgi:hypothetical protein
MDPTLIANNSISFKEIKVEVMQKNVFTCPVLCFLAFLAKNGFGLTVYSFQMKNRRSMKIYSNVPKGFFDCIACIWLTCMHSFLSYDYLNDSSYLSITPRTFAKPICYTQGDYKKAGTEEEISYALIRMIRYAPLGSVAILLLIY